MPSGNRTLTPTPLPTGEGLKRRASLGRSRSDFMTTIASNGYQSGFGNEFATEAVPGALPQGRNSPQKVAHGRYAEQLSGTAFTAPRGHNRRSWLYRFRPDAEPGTFEPSEQPRFTTPFGDNPVPTDPLRSDPPPLTAA